MVFEPTLLCSVPLQMGKEVHWSRSSLLQLFWHNLYIVIQELFCTLQVSRGDTFEVITGASEWNSVAAFRLYRLVSNRSSLLVRCDYALWCVRVLPWGKLVFLPHLCEGRAAAVWPFFSLVCINVFTVSGATVFISFLISEDFLVAKELGIVIVSEDMIIIITYVV